ncbi:DUF4003 family protein [Paenilisteria rocourtiae]|uniref:Uncharacterized protein DUF4003 n=1 Tax=Listeria rocourtiae TaxID=647910 RepID=A0A4R6ZK05_9LIST|nr:DUF4003 family protein [Listeria rocourtiae]EUJ47816.1 hypothetical protein PROCOU_07408 [Listeria rocourtiae FSL F6-920]MBC1435060.1 DUF4003 family protein [Listeria rocourtiae]MBC1604549.1 DUF4003 family protein [Listeria rocourtiae]TDR52628.1 uncharacterized protein DUF4003 [Listeria rocourtiae]
MTEFAFDSGKIVQQLLVNFQEVNNSGVMGVDKRIRFLVAQLFTSENEVIDGQAFKATTTLFKKQLGFFNALDGNTRASLAGLLLVNGQSDEKTVARVIDHYELLVEAGFKRTNFTYFGAYLLLKADKPKHVATRAHDIYMALRKQHPFLTGAEDVTSAVLMAQLDTSLSVEQLAMINEYYFTEFNRAGFRKNDSLQFLAATSTLIFLECDVNHVKKVVQLMKELERADVKIRPLHYVTLGILAYVQESTELDVAFFDLLEAMRHDSGLRWNREFYTAMALSLYTEEQARNMTREQVESLMVSVHVLIAIERAAAASAAAAASVAAASSGGS